MTKKIAIVTITSTHKRLPVIAQHIIDYQSIDRSSISHQEFYDLAWDSSVEDGDVEKNLRHLYNFDISIM